MSGIFWILALVGAVVAALLVFGRRRPDPAPAVSAPAAAEDHAPAPAVIEDGDNLTEKLHRLDETLFPFANTSAHPRDLGEKAEFREAVALLSAPDVPLDRVLRYVHGANWVLASAALAALAERPDRQEALDAVLMQLDRLAAWSLQFALDYILTLEVRPPVGAAFLAANDNWRDHPVLPSILREHLDGRRALGDAPAFGTDLALVPAWRIAAVRTMLEALRHPFADALLRELSAAPSGGSDDGFLATVGRFWDLTDADDIVEPEDWRDPIASAAAQMVAGTAHSTLVIGEPLAGKTSYLKRLAARAAADGVRVFEAGGSDLMAGQQWLGQLEERIRRTLDELSKDRKIVWFVPDLLQLARSGTNQTQSQSLLDQILPAIAARRVTIWAEANPTIAARLFQARPLLRSLLEQVQIEAPPEERAKALAQAVAEKVAAKAGLTIAPESVPLAIDAAKQFLGAASLPGSAIQLLKLAAKEAADGDARLGPDAIYRVLAQLSGLPQTILDARAPIDLNAARAFFDKRVIGQDEAVTAMVERIAMLKAGLNDPGKPIGVFLFAGPTGTGKTELAKATADYLFGSADRMIRLDMSEFQMPESVGKLIGDSYLPADAETLVNRVRKQPFSVVLLDEFEKAHSRIWDLFLQVFDEGRLSDVSGQLADFRHAIIILTSNLGATSHQGAGLGFAPAAGTFSNDQVMRAIAQTYRPEFQNRLDRVIVFQPLTREKMRSILAKELARVLDRRGIKDRTWAVEFESTALDFLLEKGFSPEMGARPLKRVIDRYLLAPLAATIVERRFPEGDQFVFVRSDGRALQAEFVDPDREPADAPESPAPVGENPSLARMILAPGGTAEEAATLRRTLAGIETTLASPAWSELVSGLAREMAEPAFWQAGTRFRTLARYALTDRVTAAVETARSLAQRLDRKSSARRAVSRELVGRLAQQLRLVEDGVRDALEAAPVEVAVRVEAALDGGSAGSEATLRWCREVFGMYAAWCRKRHMTFEEVDRGPGDLPILLVSGFGANRVLVREVGLHVLEDGDSGGTGARAVARMTLAEAPLETLPRVHLLNRLAESFAAQPRPTEVVRRYRKSPAPLVRDPRTGWRSGRLDAVLAGDFDLMVPTSPGDVSDSLSA